MGEKVFTGDEAFEAFRTAEEFLANRGFSVGSMQRDDPIGVMYGDCSIAKWRNLSAMERIGLHGVIQGNKRFGPVTVVIFDTAPMEAQSAFAKEIA